MREYAQTVVQATDPRRAMWFGPVMDANRRVLLVEDDPIIAMLYEDALADTEFEIDVTAGSNAQALAELARDLPDLAIVDYILSDGEAHPLMAELERRAVPFLVVTGRGDDARIGAAPKLGKPFLESALRAALRALPPSPRKE